MKRALKASGKDWELKVSMKENLLRISEKIQGYMDLNHKKVDGLELFSDLESLEEDEAHTQKVLIKHPDHEELIPATCSYAHGHVHVNFDGNHPYLGTNFNFKNFEKPGLANIGDRYIQIYLRKGIKDQKNL